MWNLVSHTKSRCSFGVFRNSKSNCAEDIIQPVNRLEKRFKLEVNNAKTKKNSIAELNSAINLSTDVIHKMMCINY